MQLLIPFASPQPEAGRRAAATLQLPHLRALLGRLDEVLRDAGDESSWSPPHERALARALGLRGGDGLLPWAARSALADGLDTGALAWGLVTPAHWHLGTDQVSMLDPALLELDETGSRACLDAVRELFTDEGFGLHWGAPLRWYLTHESLATLACASLDRVVGRNVDAWLGRDAAAMRLRRLQSELQMLLYTHPLNARRQEQGLLPVNSFWLSGCGVAQPATGVAPIVDDRLRSPLLANDWAAWCQAWQALDEGPLAAMLAAAEQGQPVQLTLCGERAAVTWAGPAQGLRGRWHAWRPAPALAPLLEAL